MHAKPTCNRAVTRCAMTIHRVRDLLVSKLHGVLPWALCAAMFAPCGTTQAPFLICPKLTGDTSFWPAALTVRAADFNHDGLMDFVRVTTGGFTLFMQGRDGRFT